MSTGQKYSGKGEDATLPEQTATNAISSADSAGTNPRIYQAQTRLLELSDSFLAIGYQEGPMQVVNNLLTHWLTTSPQALTQADDSSQLHCILLLIDTLGELYQVPPASRCRSDKPIYSNLSLISLVQ